MDARTELEQRLAELAPGMEVENGYKNTAQKGSLWIDHVFVLFFLLFF